MKSILESHSEMLDYISKNSGRPVTNVLEVTCSFELFLIISFEINQLDYLYDTLLVETIYNKTLPEWTKVKNVSLSSSKSITFTCVIRTAYGHYIFKIHNVHVCYGHNIFKQSCGFSLEDQLRKYNQLVRDAFKENHNHVIVKAAIKPKENHKSGEGQISCKSTTK